MNLKGRNFLTLKDFTPDEIRYLIDLAADLKAKKKAGELHEYYKGKNIALIFEKTSTRTRCAFEVAAHDLGMGTRIWILQAPRSAKKKVLQTQPEFLAECTMELSTEALDRKLLRSLPLMREYRYGTV